MMSFQFMITNMPKTQIFTIASDLLMGQGGVILDKTKFANYVEIGTPWTMLGQI